MEEVSSPINQPNHEETMSVETPSVVQEFKQKVAEKKALNLKRGLPEDIAQSQAVSTVATNNPELHKQFLLATNPSAKAKRLINEKYN